MDMEIEATENEIEVMKLKDATETRQLKLKIR